MRDESQLLGFRIPDPNDPCPQHDCPLFYCAHGCAIDSINKLPGTCRYLVGQRDQSLDRLLREKAERQTVVDEYQRAIDIRTPK